jgi:putative hemolysin
VQLSTAELLLRGAGIALLILANGFFVSIEFAAIASRRTRVEHLAGEGGRGAAIVARWLNTSATRDRLVAAAQVGITIASLALGALGESTFAVLIEPPLAPLAAGAAGALRTALLLLPSVLAVLLFTMLHVVYGEQLPKVLVLRNPEGWAARMAPAMQVFMRLAAPFVVTLDALAVLSLGLLGLRGDGHEHRSLYTVDELKEIMVESEQSGVLERSEREMLHAVFDFGDMRARQVMVPRTEMVAVAAQAPLDELVKLAVETALSKFPVYESASDNIVGLVHVKDMLRALSEARRDATARDLMREPLYAPESLPVDELLREMRARRRHTAVVLDEYGGTSGLVTLEDLLEEIIGDIDDVFVRADPEIVRRPDGSARVSGLAQIEVVNEAFGLRLSDPHYDTIAGYVLGRLGRLAEPGDEIEADGAHLRVDALDGRRIAYLVITPPGNAPAKDQPPA